MAFVPKPYGRGSVTRIQVKNFVTYDYAEFRPGAGLNVVVGPNGSGKSSIVSALALGLAGNTQVLGRGDRISSFVKHGKTDGYVELELAVGDGRTQRIRRNINANDSTSIWFIDDQRARAEDVRELVKELNVQIDNLCQFLPQEKVSEFSYMTPIRLLKETEKALKDGELEQLHEEVVVLSNEEKKLRSTCEANEDILNENRAILERSKVEVERIKQRAHHEEQARKYELKLPWARFEAKRIEILEIVQERKAIDANIRQLQALLEPKRDQVKELLQQIGDEAIEAREVKARQTEIQKQCKAIAERVDKAEDAIEELQTSLSNIDERVADFEARTTEIQSKITKYEEQRDAMPSLEELEAAIKESQTRVSKARQLFASHNTDIDDLTNQISQVDGRIQALNEQVRALGQHRRRVLEHIRKNDRDTAKVYDWIHQRQNATRFNMPVLGPVCMELDIKTRLHQQQIDLSLPRQALRSFICQCEEDRDAFLAEFKDRQNLSVDVVLVLPDDIPNTDTSAALQAIKHLGVTSMLIDLCTTHAVVRAFLCTFYRLDTIPVGPERLAGQQEALFQAGHHVSVCGDSQFSSKRSKYSKDMSTRVITIKDRSFYFLLGNDSSDQLEQAQADLKAEQEKHIELAAARDQLRENGKALQAELTALGEEHEANRKRATNRRRMDTSIKSQREQLKSHLKNKWNPDAEREKLRGKINAQEGRKLKCFNELVAIISEAVAKQPVIDKAAIHRSFLKRKVTELEAQQELDNVALEDLRRQKAEVMERVNQGKDEVRQLRAKAEKKCPLDKETMEKFSELPDSVEELENRIAEHRGIVDTISRSDPNMIREYEKRMKAVAQLEGEQAERRASLEDVSKQLAAKLQAWVGPLEVMVSELNETFSSFFRRINCGGEVRINKDNDSGDYAKWGLEIRVKFRDSDDFHVLSGKRQSGGERSMSTMLFLLALQRLTPVPFRVVDEINQGMDANNERIVFNLVVKLAEAHDSPQYFMVTPKLLPGLAFEPSVTLICVFNGPGMIPQKVWDGEVKQVPGRKRVQALAGGAFGKKRKAG